ncbi:MAG: glycosyltransferase family 4 protein [Eggerthellaceae bacterium]|nr:glycosyltransferase family 4 protein [Eggerthellaceae bacterium]
MAGEHCICLFSSLYQPSIGGVETYTASLARALAASSCRVIVVTCALQKNEGIFNENGIEVIRLPSRPFLDGRFPIPRRSNEAQRLWRWLGNQQIDYIEVNTRFYPLSVQALAFAEAKGIVPLLIEHGSAHLTLGNALLDIGVQAVEHAMTRRCLAYPAEYYAVSRNASAWLRHFGIQSHGELPNSIDADEYVGKASTRDYRRYLNIPPSAFLVSYIGRLVSEKGVMAIAKASATLKNSGIVFAIAGSGPLEDNLRSFESPSFRLLGKLSREDVAALLQQSDLMCLPSRSEGFATSLLEAAACATPSLVTAVGGTDELVPSSDFGIILPNIDARTISDTMLQIVRHRDQLHHMGKNASQLVRAEYSWSKTARKTLDACKKANYPVERNRDIEQSPHRGTKAERTR